MVAEDDAGRSSESEQQSRKRKRSRRRRSSSTESCSSESASSSSDGDDSNRDERHSRHRKRHKKKESEEREERRRREKKRKLKEQRRKEEKKQKKKKERSERHKKGPSKSWGKYGLVKETDMWTKRPEFTAWLAEVKKVNMETLSTRDEKLIFKEYMEDFNTATFPSKKYYNIDKYFHRKLIKKMEKGAQSLMALERTEFNDEEQRRQEIRLQREHQKEAEVDTLKMSMMGTGMAQAMKEQAQLREEMQYQFRLGNVEAANAIQRRLIPDSAKQQE